MKLNTGELIIKKGDAGQWGSGYVFIGTLYLTNQRLLFKPSRGTIGAKQISISLLDILAVDTPHRVSLKLAIVLKDRSVELFMVRNRKEWMKRMTRLMGPESHTWQGNRELKQAIEEESRRILKET